MIAVRLVWFFTTPYLIRVLDRRLGQRRRRVGARARLVIAWAGTRGAVSLAAALALPLHTHPAPVPQRDLIIFLTFAVIFATLVLQGLSLPALIRRLGITRDGSEDHEEIRARLIATKAALAELDELEREEWTRDDTIERMRRMYEYRKRRFAAQAGKIEDDGYEDRSLAYQQVVQAVLAAQRDALDPSTQPGRDLERNDEPGDPGARPRGIAARDLSTEGSRIRHIGPAWEGRARVANAVGDTLGVGCSGGSLSVVGGRGPQEGTGTIVFGRHTHTVNLQGHPQARVGDRSRPVLRLGSPRSRLRS